MLFGLCASDQARMAAARDWGYDYVEIGARAVAPLEPDQAWPARKRQLEDIGATITHLAGFIPAEARFVGPEVDWGRVRGYLESCVGRAAELGVRTFNWGSAPSKSVPLGWPFSKAFEQIERCAHLIADVMAPLDCTCAIEPINPLECNVIYYLTDAALLAASVDRPQIRVNVDYYHMALQNEPWQHMDAAKEWIAHAHTSGPNRHFPNPDDPFDHRRFLAELRRIGFDRTCSFECGRIPEGADYAAEARAGIAYIRQLYAEVSSTPSAAPRTST
jgi:D-psicose/D-tagatose/L-ribulose 3-epimerase